MEVSVVISLITYARSYHFNTHGHGVCCRTGKIHAQLSGGARAALIFVIALDYHISLCGSMSLTCGRHAFQKVAMTSCMKM